MAGDIAENIFGGPWCFIGTGMLVHGCVWGGWRGGSTVYIEVQLPKCHGKMINKFGMKQEKLMLPYSTCFAFTELNIDKAKGCFHCC